MNDELESM